jgi:hypothetical protein
MNNETQRMTETEKAIIDFCGHHADWWPSTTQVQEMLALAQPEHEPVAWMSHNKENFVSADDVGNSVPNWTDYYPTPLYTTPPPCPTCEALARTVMLDQTSHDRHKREWVGLTDDEVYKIAFALEGEHWRKIADAIEAKLKEKNT